MSPPETKIKRVLGYVGGAIGCLIGLAIIAAIIGAAVSGGNDKVEPKAKAAATSTGSPAATYHSVIDAGGFQCRSDKTDKHSFCPDNNNYCKTAAQLHSQAVAHLRAQKALEARQAAARAARKAARQAAVRAANAWHEGYVLAPQDEYGSSGPVYSKWVNGLACAPYMGEYGCWHLQVIARDGCPSYVGAEANEYQGGKVVGSLLDNNATGLPPKTPVAFELDADQAGVTADDLKISCS